MKPDGKVVKYTEPTRYDQHPQGTIWRNVNEIWIQVSPVQTDPEWIRLGSFLERSLQMIIEDDAFLFECLRLYQHFKNKPEEIIKQRLLQR